MGTSKKKKRDEKYKKRIIIGLLIIFVLLLLLIVAFIFYFKMDSEEDKIKNRQGYENVLTNIKNERYKKGEIVPDEDNIYTRLYNGTVSDSVLYGKIYYLVSVAIPNINNNLGNMSDIDLRDYYSNNKARIEQGIGSTSQQEFVDFVKYIKSCNLVNYKNARYDSKNYEDGQDYATIPLILEYEEGSATITMRIAKRNGMPILVTFKNQ